MTDRDSSMDLQESVRAALAGSAEPIAIAGSGSRSAFDLQPESASLDLRAHTGVIDYEPDELVLRVRAGTRLDTLRELLAAEGQQFAADIPAPATHSTIGGAVACGWDGPARAFSVSLRDTVLGCRMINGRGHTVNFGGQVMKNVAGYDCARLQVGAFGTLGVLLDVSLRVSPQPEVSVTRSFDVDTGDLSQWWQRTRALRPLISATCHCDGQLHLRLSGRAVAVEDAVALLGGEASAFDWAALRDLRQDFFHGDALACVYLPRGVSMPVERGTALLEWEGARIWVRGGDHGALQQAAAACGGFVQVLRGAPLPPQSAAADWHRRIKAAFDPSGVFNQRIFHERFVAGDRESCR
ncbi:glycolate oxidase subunit GlcE [Microbulbifer hainanensis]|uniref:glycolate oxidase subunit GlcE n=1 Tax=Microbulbifer hainanensis TaxID=2735675 RepID=UPI001867344E|nr:glycolate oxidase subunit GlcE [Microbulbifer hainanensis]